MPPVLRGILFFIHTFFRTKLYSAVTIFPQRESFKSISRRSRNPSLKKREGCCNWTVPSKPQGWSFWVLFCVEIRIWKKEKKNNSLERSTLYLSGSVRKRRVESNRENLLQMRPDGGYGIERSHAWQKWSLLRSNQRNSFHPQNPPIFCCL